MLGGLVGLALSYGAGALSTLSPCVLPLLPIVLFGVIAQHAWGPVALTAGLAVSFTAVGLFVALLGFSIGIDATVLRLGGAAFMTALGAVFLLPSLESRLAAAATPVAMAGQSLRDRLRPTGLGGQFILGVLLGAIWSPCSGPALGAAIGLAAQSETAAWAGLVMITFSLGAATPVLVLAYGSRTALLARRASLARLSQFGKPAMGSALIAVGLFILTGLDRIVETFLTRAMPDWLVALTTRL
jgi:cytochrome c-type biogenesis protein